MDWDKRVMEEVTGYRTDVRDVKSGLGSVRSLQSDVSVRQDERIRFL